jgi:cytochrome c oxidase cbb3-type subunit 2
MDRAARCARRHGAGITVTARPWRLTPADAPGVVAVAAVYVYFLLFAQYGLLRLMAERLPSARIEPVMTAMGLGGLVASAGTAWLLRWSRARLLVVIALVFAVVLALVAPRATTVLEMVLIGAGVGVAVGASTVTLSSELERWVRSPARAMAAALGTGAAYLIVNWPALFAASPQRQAVVAAIAAAVGAIALAAGGRAAPSDEERLAATPLVASIDLRWRGVAAAAVAFVALVGLDSAAFAIIQHDPTLAAVTWANGGGSLRMGVLHIAGAVACALLLERRRFFTVLGGVLALFTVGIGLLARGGALASGSGALYAIGIGAYSTALVVFPSAGPQQPGPAHGGHDAHAPSLPRRWRAAIVYGVGGWIGSGLGIGLASHVDHIPLALIAVAGALFAAALLMRESRLAPALTQSLAIATLCGGLAAWTHGVSPALARRTPAAPSSRSALAARAQTPLAGTSDQAARGREVYIAEGCLYCHSQYVREQGRDRELWGPRRADAGVGDPPLYGTRRQGPDLANVANRRSAAWQRLHLIDPLAVSPGSRMPSYVHLFAPGDERGDELIVYLESLGAGTGTERFRDIQTSATGSRPIDSSTLDHGRSLFALYCARCHGREGRGDGPLAPALGATSAIDLADGSFAFASFGPGVGTLDEGISRVVRFGMPGRSMPGHEWLSDRDVAALVARVRELASTQGKTPAPGS